MTEVSTEDYDREEECNYRGESYRVRDNGAVLRGKREGKRKRPLDESWTFGKPCKFKGYPLISSVPVHRIVATAFHGKQPAGNYVVDHEDTNRNNNRPENLRWVTRLENLLKNPITAKRIESAYGSLEAFLEDPSRALPGKLTPDFEWMRTVTPEEAKASKERLLAWAHKDGLPSGGTLGEWVFRSIPTVVEELEPKEELVQSKTHGAMQRNWRTPSKFPSCPDAVTDEALAEYCANLKPDEVFGVAHYGQSIVVQAAISEAKDALVVHCKHDENAVKDWSVAKVSIEKGVFVHESLGTFFTLEGAEKVFTIERGLQWDGGDTFDDYC
ncbi:HNH endonuclease signature motif containing protein [Shimia abyssi]|uniref:HNH endonuclease n=1 Tax=Shimia abyssi TaxID=1662395 RepID=A0A2P8FFN5_9RHOB|nr:HNH endonuclease signature motif containing protein [Shimia abyssi]PSL20527.1 HNH endonuclease [Shimia abyssi]